ncbi:MAG: SpoIIE family protein phosphatase [Gammaproteobacteria bacterium]|jgi:sigma-B regulation protein RsbU (phosphoserine phosphatase)|nr:SpoIIE family protein phosphatase [Gammaproteobacteria bacterium]
MTVEALDPGAFVRGSRNLLAALPLCEGITFELFEPFFLQCEYCRLNPGDLLLSPGVPNYHLYVLLSGEIAIYIDFVGSTKNFTVAPGEFVGEVSIIDGLTPTGFVAATTDSVVLAIHESVLWREFFRIPGSARNLLRQLARRMRERNVAMQKSVEKAIRLEHLEAELRIASDLQASMLPVRPLLPTRPGVCVDALMEPAKEIGGDFYDAFALDEDTVCVVIGDVAGKGVPAALFMVRCITLLRTQMLQSRDLLHTIHAMNVMLCDDNPKCMFVTMMVCLVDVRRARLDYVNGGHNPALFGNFRDGFEFLAQPKGILLGIDPDAAYESATRKLNAGDLLVMYTDGITEAMNPVNEEFSDRRLLDFLKRQPEQPVGELVHGIQHAVREFAAGAEQSDDLTLLVLGLSGH